MFRRIAKIFFKVLWLLPGVLLWASFPPFGEKLDAIFALAPLLWVARRGETRVSAVRWLLNGLVFWLATLSWMPAIVKNGGPWPLVALGWFALAAYCALYFGAFGWLAAGAWQWARRGAYWRRLAAILLAEPILWAGLELVRSRLFGGFAWNLLGVPAVVAGFGEPAALGGVYLVGALVVLVAGTFASLAERMLAPFDKNAVCSVPRWVRSVETLLPFAVIAAVVCALKNPAPSDEGDTSRNGSPALSVALVQRNFPCVFSRGEREDPRNAYRRLLDAVAPLRPQLVVLPESAFAEIGSVGSAGAERFTAMVRSVTGARAVLAGGARRDAQNREYNCAALYAAPSAAQPSPPPQVYDKAHLVPFGEYIPFDKTFPWLQRFAPVGSCTPGELKLLDFDGIRLGAAICYEDTDSAQIRRLAEMGAQVLVFITNDSWFSHSEEAIQHAWNAVARSVETGLPVIRVGNSGVTGTITPGGAANWLMGEDAKPLIDAEGAMFDRVIPAAPDGAALSPYVRYGDTPLAMLFALVAGCVVAGWLRLRIANIRLRAEERRQMACLAVENA